MGNETFLFKAATQEKVIEGGGGIHEYYLAWGMFPNVL